MKTYGVVGYYDDIYPILLLETESLEEARNKKKEALEVFDLVRIYAEGEEVK